MRLIDADKITFFDCLARTENEVCCHVKGIVSKEGIDMQPTVEAIPIEWIEKWVDIVKERNYYTYTVLMPALIEMLEVWEKENE